jgi:hypothetical protein
MPPRNEYLILTREPVRLAPEWSRRGVLCEVRSDEVVRRTDVRVRVARRRTSGVHVAVLHGTVDERAAITQTATTEGVLGRVARGQVQMTLLRS